MVRKVAGVEATPDGKELSATDDSYNNGKTASAIGTPLFFAIVLLLSLILVCLFFFYSQTIAPGADPVLRGSRGSPAGIPSSSEPMHQETREASSSTSSPAPSSTASTRWRHPLQQDAGLPAGPEQPAPTPAAGGIVSMVNCRTTAGPITIAVHHDWSPHGATRFLDMVRDGFFSTQVAFFRSVRGFLCQTGIAGAPAVHKSWKAKGNIKDDPQWLDRSVKNRMKRGYLSFAGGGSNTRGTEFFFAFRDLPLGTTPWEVPFGTLVGHDSFQTMDHWYTGYGDLPQFGGRAPRQARMYNEGLPYLQKDFPEIDYITGCDVSVQESGLSSIPGYKTTYMKLKEGSGAAVHTGNTVSVHATGVVQETGKKFWSTKDPGQQAFSYKAGLGQVITGWDQGLLGAQIGEERKVIIPADEGYGAGGFPAWGIPPGATLEFTLEVLRIE